MNLCLGRVTVSVVKLKCHPRIFAVSDNPPSAFNLSLQPLACKGWVYFCCLVGLLPQLQVKLWLLVDPCSLCLVGQLLILLCCWCKRLSNLCGWWGCSQLVPAQSRKVLHCPNILVLGSFFVLMHVMCLDLNLCISTACLLNCKLFPIKFPIQKGKEHHQKWDKVWGLQVRLLAVAWL